MLFQDMEPWISLPKSIPSELAQRAEEVCRDFEVHRSNSDDPMKARSCMLHTCVIYVVICIHSCTTLWQVQSVLRAAARESKPGDIIDSKTMEKKAKEMKRGRGIGRGRGRGRGKGKGRGKGRGRKQPCQRNEEEDSDENAELKLLDEEDVEIRRSLGMEEDFEKEDIVSGSMLWLHVFLV